MSNLRFSNKYMSKRGDGYSPVVFVNRSYEGSSQVRVGVIWIDLVGGSASFEPGQSFEFSRHELLDISSEMCQIEADANDY